MTINKVKTIILTQVIIA